MKQRRDGTRGQADHGLGKVRRHGGNRSHAIGHGTTHPQRHEAAVAQSRGINAVSVYGVLEGELVQHLIQKGNIIGRLRLILGLIRILAAALSAPGIATAATAGYPPPPPG